METLCVALTPGRATTSVVPLCVDAVFISGLLDLLRDLLDELFISERLYNKHQVYISQ